jgi:integrase
VRRPPEPPARRRIISDAERDALLAAWGYQGRVETVAHEAAVALLMALETAMRAGEILGLEWSRVDLTARVARLERTKNGDRREVPLSKRAVELLQSMRGRKLAHVRAVRDDGRIWHIDVDTLGVLFRRACRTCGIEGLHFHDSRATAITRLARVLSPVELARMIGHRDLGSLLVYYRESASSIAERLS